MYSYIKGTLVNKKEDQIVIDCNNIGYRIFVPLSVLDAIPEVGSLVTIYTYLHVREDAMLLYGFLSDEDKEMFKLLINVSGIGPKGALSILSAMTPDELRFAIVSDDDKAITKANGIGKKIAQKLIIELRDKIDLSDVLTGSRDNDAAMAVNNSSLNDSRNEAIEALISLGYSSTESFKAVSNVNIIESMNTEDVLKEALKKLAF